jgi:hypothetical protein
VRCDLRYLRRKKQSNQRAKLTGPRYAGREEIRATLKAALRDGICVCNSSRTGLARDCSRCSRLRAQAGAL